MKWRPGRDGELRPRETGPDATTAQRGEPTAPSTPRFLAPRPLAPLAEAVRPHSATEALPASPRVRSEQVRSGAARTAGFGQGMLPDPLPWAEAARRGDPWPQLPARPGTPPTPAVDSRVVRDVARAERLVREQAAM